MLKFASSKVKEFLLVQVSEELQQPLDIVEKVVAFQGEDTLKAFACNKSIEISGFIKFLLSQNKVNKTIKNYTKVVDELTGKEDVHSQNKLKGFQEHIIYLNTRLC